MGSCILAENFTDEELYRKNLQSQLSNGLVLEIYYSTKLNKSFNLQIAQVQLSQTWSPYNEEFASQVRKHGFDLV